MGGISSLWGGTTINHQSVPLSDFFQETAVKMRHTFLVDCLYLFGTGTYMLVQCFLFKCCPLQTSMGAFFGCRRLHAAAGVLPSRHLGQSVNRSWGHEQENSPVFYSKNIPKKGCKYNGVTRDILWPCSSKKAHLLKIQNAEAQRSESRLSESKRSSGTSSWPLNLACISCLPDAGWCTTHVIPSPHHSSTRKSSPRYTSWHNLQGTFRRSNFEE